MKKQILFFAAFLFAATMVFAQHCADCDIQQIPTGPRGAALNTSDVDQFGYDHTATVTQEGMYNYSYVLQDGDRVEIVHAVGGG